MKDTFRRAGVVARVFLLTVSCAGEREGAPVNPLPSTSDLESLVIRTDFTDDAAWSRVKTAVAAPVGEFRAYVRFVDDRRYDGLTLARLLELVPAGSETSFLFLADSVTIADPDHPVLIVGLTEQRGRFFRVIPREMWAVQNNLIIGNADWEDFAGLADGNGIYRGLPPELRGQ
jgi:hypothetical protein